MRTKNPALNRLNRGGGYSSTSGEVMTVNGTINKIGILLLFASATALFTWSKGAEQSWNLMIAGVVGGLIFAIITIFKAEWARVTAPLYALCEGLLLGGLSAYYNHLMPGLPFQAVLITFGILFAMLFLYRTGVIKVTGGLAKGIVAATGGIFLVYLSTWILGFFGISVPFLHQASPIGIGISVFIVIIAAMNLLLDFKMIDDGVEQGMPADFEWFAAFGLMVTLVWLYIEVLRLLWMLYSFFDD